MVQHKLSVTRQSCQSIIIVQFAKIKSRVLVTQPFCKGLKICTRALPCANSISNHSVWREMSWNTLVAFIYHIKYASHEVQQLYNLWSFGNQIDLVTQNVKVKISKYGLLLPKAYKIIHHVNCFKVHRT